MYITLIHKKTDNFTLQNGNEAQSRTVLEDLD